MTDQSFSTLLTALDIVAFERQPDGAFRRLAAPPPWFASLTRDGTFPFLGHILEEAQTFWNSGREGVCQWGPCADVDDDGAEFHYIVKALRINLAAFLVFQRDDSAERVRDVLQKVRSEALAAAQKKEPR
jgi:hypothetical protein